MNMIVKCIEYVSIKWHFKTALTSRRLNTVSLKQMWIEVNIFSLKFSFKISFELVVTWAKTSTYWNPHVTSQSNKVVMNSQMWEAPCTKYVKPLQRIMQNVFKRQESVSTGHFEASGNLETLFVGPSIRSLPNSRTHGHEGTDTHFPSGLAEPAVSNFLT